VRRETKKQSERGEFFLWRKKVDFFFVIPWEMSSIETTNQGQAVSTFATQICDEVRPKLEAFIMARHVRAGINSSANVLIDDVLGLIGERLIVEAQNEALLKLARKLQLVALYYNLIADPLLPKRAFAGTPSRAFIRWALFYCFRITDYSEKHLRWEYDEMLSTYRSVYQIRARCSCPRCYVLTHAPLALEDEFWSHFTQMKDSEEHPEVAEGTYIPDIDSVMRVNPPGLSEFIELFETTMGHVSVDPIAFVYSASHTSIATEYHDIWRKARPNEDRIHRQFWYYARRMKVISWSHVPADGLDADDGYEAHQAYFGECGEIAEELISRGGFRTCSFWR
jgi:hypothetical protein